MLNQFLSIPGPSTRNPSLRSEWWLWALLAIAILLPRVYASHLVPEYLWSNDAGSYANPATHWLDTGQWITDARRGPIYSLLIAACLKIGGSFNSLILCQHFLGASAIFLGLLLLRSLVGPGGQIPFLLCGWAYAVYAGPLLLELVVRNETILFATATVTLVTWFFSVKRQSLLLLFLTGISLGILTLTKNVYAALIPFLPGAEIWAHRRDLTAGATRVTIFALAFVLPFLGKLGLDRVSAEMEPRDPQAGLLLFARVAQFVDLDSPLETKLKQAIRPDIEGYRKNYAAKGKLDNNVILYRTAIPRMRKLLLAEGKTRVDLNRACKKMAMEAIRKHPVEYLTQVGRDLFALHFEMGRRLRGPQAEDVKGAIEHLTDEKDHPLLHRPETVARLQPATEERHFRGYRLLADSAWLFQAFPVLFTSLLLPWLIRREKGPLAIWWVGCAVVWYTNLLLLSTVGRPMNRYLLPVTPVMFWALGTGFAIAWRSVAARWKGSQTPATSDSPRPE